MRYHYPPMTVAKIQNVTIPNVDGDVKQQELSFTASGSAKWYSHFRG